MSDSTTLHSRLRVLIAKTFRAEKLFQSMKTGNNTKPHLASVSDIANDVRAKEWQKAHHDLRSELNEIVTLAKQSQLVQELVQLRETFLSRAEQDRREIESGISALTEAACREEFAQGLRLSVELVRVKARSQVNKAVADELSAVLGGISKSESLDEAPLGLQTSGRGANRPNVTRVELDRLRNGNIQDFQSVDKLNATSADAAQDINSDLSQRGKIIELRPKVARG